MKIVDIREASVPISRYADPAIAASLTTSVVAVVTDHRGDDGPLIGYGFASVGRFAQGGLIRERFAPRLWAAPPVDLRDDDTGSIDPCKAWAVMMQGEKPGGHGERCVAVGTLDMALWDLAAKAAGLPLHRMLSMRFGGSGRSEPIPVYAGGGYYYPDNDLKRLEDEVRAFRSLGFTRVKIKIGSASLSRDLERIERVLSIVGDGNSLAVDAMNSYGRDDALDAASALKVHALAWFEDICDPLDYETHRRVTDAYGPPISAGEALFSRSDARNLRLYGGLRPDRDVLTFDPAHSYGLPEYVRMIEDFEAGGWTRRAFQPHGGHLYGLHVAAGLGLGGCECNPSSFQPFGGFGDDGIVVDGRVTAPEAPGVGFETRAALMDLLRRNLSG